MDDLMANRLSCSYSLASNIQASRSGHFVKPDATFLLYCGARARLQQFRRLAGDCHLAPCAGMAEAQLSGMEVIARVAGKRACIRQRQAACAVERISHERVVRSGKVDPDLMGAARGDMDVAQKGIVPAFADSHLR
jgi:hypothetical protein